jgi:tripartite ATP-independent transporter DctP family solute receptor
MKRKKLATLTGAAGLLVLLAAAPAAAAITCKVGDVVADSHPNTLGLLKIAEIVKEGTKGEIDVQVFPNSQLGGEKEMAEGMRLGSVCGGDINVSVLSQWVPEGQLFDLPFIFRDDAHAYAVTSGPVGKQLAERYPAHGFRVLGYWINGVRHPMSKTPILKPEDVKGLKMRVIQSPLHIEVWKLLGANPTPIAFSETYNALQTGVVDFTDNSKSTYWSSKLYEVVPHITNLGHIYSIGAIVFDENFWKKLTPDQQKVLQAAVDEAVVYQNKLLAEDDAAALAKAVAAGAQVHETDKTPWQEATAPIYESWAAKVGGMDVIKAVQNTK